MFFPLGDNRGDVPVRATSFALPGRILFWPRVCLYSDRLVLTGWYFWGRYRRSISLDRVEQTEADGGRVHVHLASGAQLQLDVPNPEAWARVILVHCEARDP